MSCLRKWSRPLSCKTPFWYEDSDAANVLIESSAIAHSVDFCFTLNYVDLVIIRVSSSDSRASLSASAWTNSPKGKRAVCSVSSLPIEISENKPQNVELLIIKFLVIAIFIRGVMYGKSLNNDRKSVTLTVFTRWAMYRSHEHFRFQYRPT